MENNITSHEEYSFGLILSVAPSKSLTDEVYRMFFYCFWEETIGKSSRVATNIFSSVCVIVTTCFYEIFF